MMIEPPPRSRNQLEWSRFEPAESGDWFLNLPPYYALLFENQHPFIMKKSDKGWYDSKSEITKYVFLSGLEKIEVETIRNFIDDYKKLVVIGINKNIKDQFDNELDSCMALDYHFIKRVDKRTEIGALEYLAKYEEDDNAINMLVENLLKYINRMPNLKNAGNISFCYVAPDPDKKFHLPRILTEKMVRNTKKDLNLDDYYPIIHSKLKVKKPQLKRIDILKKISVWENLIFFNQINISTIVQDRDIILLDDLYQSGVSIWSMAKFLKMNGARMVLGLTCTKTLRDTDNL